MRHLVPLVMLLAILAPSALADIPPPEPHGKRTTLIVIAAGVAIVAALLAFARIVRRRTSA